MWSLVAIPATCSVSALVAAPRRARVGNEVAEPVNARLLGRQQRLVLLALLVTSATLIGAVAALLRRIYPDLHALRDARGMCIYPLSGGPVCPVLQPGGKWGQAQAQRDGSWLVVPTATGPVLATNPYDDPATHMR